MKSNKTGEELSQISHFLFTSAANKWYLALILEIAAGMIAVIFSILPSVEWVVILGAAIGTGFLIVAYCLRESFKGQYTLAEEIRRQSVLTEAVEWPVNKTTLSRWRQSAGKRVIAQVKQSTRAADYYASQLPQGYKRLKEMTMESAFYTRHLYGKLKEWGWRVFGIVTGGAVLAIVLPITGAIPNNMGLVVAKALFAIIPTALAVNVLGTVSDLGRMADQIVKIEDKLEELRPSIKDFELQVLRLVTEYNCIVASGIPIHNRLFQLWHDEIRELWEKRWEDEEPEVLRDSSKLL